MARSKYLTSRKEYKCSICGNSIEKGTQYVKVWNFYQTYQVHTECYKKAPRSRWETSEYKGTLLDIQDNWDKYQDIDDLISSIEELQSDLEDKFYNMPEQLAEGSIISERKDAVEQALYDLEDARTRIEELEEPDESDYENNDEYLEAYSDYENELENINDDISNIFYDLEI